MQKNKRSLEGQVGAFVQQYAQRSGKQQLNDRRYSRKVEGLVKRMDPMDLAELLGQLDDDADSRQADPSAEEDGRA